MYRTNGFIRVAQDLLRFNTVFKYSHAVQLITVNCELNYFRCSATRLTCRGWRRGQSRRWWRLPRGRPTPPPSWCWMWWLEGRNEMVDRGVVSRRTLGPTVAARTLVTVDTRTHCPAAVLHSALLHSLTLQGVLQVNYLWGIDIWFKINPVQQVFFSNPTQLASTLNLFFNMKVSKCLLGSGGVHLERQFSRD